MAKKTTDVHDSNAGHDFHLLWATRRLIELLKPKTTLTAVKMEGVAIEDTEALAAGGDHFLGADLTEYYGGGHFDEANKTVISQLKYSTRHPSKAWTIGRIWETSGKDPKTGINRPDSVGHRLATAYADLQNGAGRTRDQVQEKTSIRLVSNQPLQEELREMMESISYALQSLGASQVNLAQLLNEVEEKYHDNITKFYTVLSQPTEEDFTDFLRVLDLSGCGADPRMGQQLAMLEEIAPSVPVGRRDALLRLKNLVHQQALPEYKNDAPLARKDVLVELGVSSEDELFPEPASLKLPKNLVSTNEAIQVRDLLLAADNQYIVAHGEAGVGKTTTVQQVPALLPTGSVMITYDCYAGGDYYNLGSGRHTLKRALHQLSNELAVVTGIPFLVSVPDDRHALLDSFCKRLQAAAQIVEAGGGLLVLAIDAADNSVIRGEQEPHYDAFVPYLWELVLPANCRLLMTARTHRVESLFKGVGRKPRIKEFGLSGFDANASAIRFQQVFPTASTASQKEFHLITRGNPRVQDYWLEPGGNPAGSNDAFLYCFQKKGTTAVEIIEDIVRAAVVEIPNQNQEKAQEQLATLVSLQRPIPIAVFASACDISIPEATIFCHALRPGLLFEQDNIAFRDEDFETQLRVRPETATRIPAAHHRLADHFRPLASTDAYAAQAVAEHYAAAKRYPELLDLAFTDPYAEIITDSVVRLRTQRRRMALAMQAAVALRDDLSGAKLVILAAGSLRANAAVRALVHANVELAARFGEKSTVLEHYHEESDTIWMGEVHYRLAAYYAANPAQQELAKDHLKHGYAWVGRYMRLPKHEKRHLKISALDIACETETIYRLKGPETAYDSISRWRPLQVRLDSLRLLVLRLSLSVDSGLIEKEIRSLCLPLLGQCFAMAALWEAGHCSSVEWVCEVAEKLLQVLPRNHIKPIFKEWRAIYDETLIHGRWPIHLAELFIHSHVDPAATVLLLDKLLPSFPASAIRSRLNFTTVIEPAQVASIRAYAEKIPVSAELLAPVLKLEKKAKGYEEETYEVGERRKFLDAFLDLFAYRTRILAGALTVEEATSFLDRGLAQLYHLRSSSDHESFTRQHHWLINVGAMLTKLSGTETLLEQLYQAVPDAVGRDKARKIYQQIAAVALLNPEYKLLALRWLENVAEDVEQDSVALTNRWQTLLRCSELSLPYDEFLSESFYGRALNAAHQGIGDEIAQMLKVSTTAVSRLQGNITPDVGHITASRLGALIEAYGPYISDEVTLPYDEALEASARIHPAAGAALCLRWDAKDIHFIENGVDSLAQGLTQAGFLPANHSIWLLKLLGDTPDFAWPATRLLEVMPNTSVLERQQLAEVLTVLAGWVERDAPRGTSTKALHHIVDWAKAQRFDGLPALQKITKTIQFVEGLNQPKPELKSKLAHTAYQDESDKEKATWDEECRKGNIGFFKELAESDRSPDESLVSYIIQLADRVSSVHRTEILDLLSRVYVYSGHREHPTLNALKGLLQKWKSFRLVIDWAESGIADFYSRGIHSITGDHDYPSFLDELCQLPLAGASRAALLLPAIYTKLDLLNSDQLCRVATALSATVNPQQQRDFSEWLLNHLENQLIADGKTLPFTALLPEPVVLPSPAVLYAQFVWVLLGHPDKRVRWRAIHAARLALSLDTGKNERVAILSELLRLSQTKTAELLPQQEFYWMAARVWLLVLLDRLAHEIPADIILCKDDILFHLRNNELPHVQIRELARRIANTLIKHQPNGLNQEELARTNQATVYVADENNPTEVEDFKPAITYRKQFKFDEMDTVPYWLDPLGRIFSQGGDHIEGLVEHWICDKWGRSEEECDTASLNRSRYSHSLDRHYHSEHPTVDSLEMYLIHHALMCVAGELIDNVPISEEEHTTWVSWLENSLPSSAVNTWIADWRGPAPLLPECWNHLPAKWKHKRTQDFTLALGITIPERQGWLVIKSYYHFGKDEKSGLTHLESVLVPSEKAESLMWALYPVGGTRQAFPTNGLDDNDDEETDTPIQGFKVLSLWEEDNGTSGKGIEEHDTSSRKVYDSYPALNEFIVKISGLKKEISGRRYLDSKGVVAAEYEVWDDDLRDESRGSKHDFYSGGYRFWIRWDVLLPYMQQQQMDLLTQVTLGRSTVASRGYSEQKDDYDYGKRRFAIFRQSGTIQTMAGNCKAWSPNNSRT